MKGERVVYFDLLNIVACLAVVFLHCNNMVFTYAPGKNWAFGLGIEVVFYWAVPIFIMISGANLMKYRDRYDTKTFFQKAPRQNISSIRYLEHYFVRASFRIRTPISNIRNQRILHTFLLQRNRRGLLVLLSFVCSIFGNASVVFACGP